MSGEETRNSELESAEEFGRHTLLDGCNFHVGSALRENLFRSEQGINQALLVHFSRGSKDMEFR